jgi:hypothetical protein
MIKKILTKLNKECKKNEEKKEIKNCEKLTTHMKLKK